MARGLGQGSLGLQANGAPAVGHLPKLGQLQARGHGQAGGILGIIEQAAGQGLAELGVYAFQVGQGCLFRFLPPFARLRSPRPRP